MRWSLGGCFGCEGCCPACSPWRRRVGCEAVEDGRAAASALARSSIEVAVLDFRRDEDAEDGSGLGLTCVVLLGSAFGEDSPAGLEMSLAE